MAVHLLLFGWVNRSPSLGPIADLGPDIIDVDIRTPFRPRDPKDTRLPGSIPKAPAPPTFKPAEIPLPLPPEQTKPAEVPKQAEGDGKATEEKAKEWVVPGPETKELEKPTLNSAPAEARPAFVAPDGTGPGGQNGRGGDGGGPGTGSAWVNRPARLINREEVLANTRRFYPEVERRAGRAADVIIELEIGEDGLVREVGIIRSGGEYFDDAAQKVGRLMRFEPELKASIPVRGRKKSLLRFRLTND